MTTEDDALAIDERVVDVGEAALFKVLSSSFTPRDIVLAVFWAMRRCQLEMEMARANS